MGGWGGASASRAARRAAARSASEEARRRLGARGARHRQPAATAGGPLVEWRVECRDRHAADREVQVEFHTFRRVAEVVAEVWSELPVDKGLEESLDDGLDDDAEQLVGRDLRGR